MTVLVDASVIVAAHNPRDEHHERGLALVEALQQGVHGEPMTTDFVLDEVVTVALARTGRHAVAVSRPPDSFSLPIRMPIGSGWSPSSGRNCFAPWTCSWRRGDAT